VVASVKHTSHEQLKLLAVARLELDGSQKESAPLIAVDSVGAGVGDRVLVTLDGWGAMTAVDRFPSPIDSAVLGIIDEVEVVED
jgi:ethanolamine utilization protein EutN